jgi:hypothetical protein
MESIIVLKYERGCDDMSAHQGFYFNDESVNFDAFVGKTVFIDVRDFSSEKVLELSKNLVHLNAHYITDNMMQVAFIKSLNPNATISFYYEKYTPDIIPFVTANGFDVTFNYQTLAPERVLALHNAGVKVNAMLLTHNDEVGVLKYYNVDYITVTSNLK